MQVAISPNGKADEARSAQNTSKRLTPVDYSNLGIVKLYDWSVKDREAHDREMADYRRYLMKLCTLSREVAGATSAEDI
jgi:hypothetical protein